MVIIVSLLSFVFFGTLIWSLCVANGSSDMREIEDAEQEAWLAQYNCNQSKEKNNEQNACN